MDQNELGLLADNWIEYWHSAQGSPERQRCADATNLSDLECNEPEALWLLILEIHHRDHSAAIQQVLSAGPLEDLLAMHGETFIVHVEAEAQRDPLFAKLLGGVCQYDMGDTVWQRVKAVWDRRGWDGISE